MSHSQDKRGTGVARQSRRRQYIFVATPGGVVVHGGMATMARYMIAEWKTSGRQPELKLLNTYGPSLDNIKTMPFFFGAAAVSVAVNGILKRIAILHLHTAEYGSVLRKGLLGYLGKALGIPVVLHMHGAKFTTMWDTASPRRKAAILGVLRRADALVVLGQFWKQYLIGELGQPAEKVHVVPNGVPDPGIEPPQRKTSNDPTILFAGQVGHRKGVGDLLEALAQPKVKTLPWELVIAGSGEIDLYRKEAERLGIADRVRFLGRVELSEVSRLMRTAQIFVLPSYQEGLPMAIIEAMANALPVITTPIGAIPEMISDGDTGLLAPPGDLEALSNAFFRLLQSSELRATIGGAARQRYMRDFNVSAMCDGLEAVFNSVSIEG
jgi:glycosyltransferase involved in cell wall biosynthesis